MLSIPQIQAAVADYFKDKPVQKVRLFGSYARHEAGPESDVDLLIVFDDQEKRLSLSDLAGFLLDLEDRLSRKVDLVEEKQLFSWVRNAVLEEKLLLYAA